MEPQNIVFMICSPIADLFSEADKQMQGTSGPWSNSFTQERVLAFHSGISNFRPEFLVQAVCLIRQLRGGKDLASSIVDPECPCYFFSKV